MNIQGRFFLIIGLIFFFISPLFTLPFIFVLIYEKKKGSLLLLSMFMGFISYMIVPNREMDLARYYEYYELISSFSSKEFLIYLENKPDKLFYSFMFTFSRLELKFQWFLFFFSTFNYYVVFLLFKTVFKNRLLSKQNYFFSILFVLLSFGFLNYFASSRFTIALSFLVLSLNFFFLNQKKKMIFFYTMSFFTHTAYFIFLPLIFTLRWFKDKKKLIGVVVALTIVLAIIPLDIIMSLFSFNEGFSEKATLYNQSERRVVSLYPIISYLFLSIVVVITFGKLLKINLSKPLISKILFLYSLGSISILVTLPQGYIVFDRFLIIFKSVFTIMFLYLVIYHSIDKRNILRMLLFVSFSIYLGYSLIIYKECFSNLFNIDYLFFKDILHLKYTSDMFK